MEATALTEQELFNYIKERYLEDLVKSDHTYEYLDATSHGYRLSIELKCRHTHYDELILEKDKYESLLQQANALGFTPFYINSTPKGIYEWDLGALEAPEGALMRLPDKTDFAGAKKIDKLVGFLDIKDSRLLLI